MPFNPPKKLAETFINVSVAKGNLAFMPMLILGIFAGAYIGFGAELCTMVLTGTSAKLGVGVAKLLGGSVFSVGLMLVVIGGAELFTGNNLMSIGLATGKINGGQLMRNWIVVYLANFIGSILLVIIMFYSGLWKTACVECGHTGLNIAVAKCNLDFTSAFCRGIGCNWLVCLAVWLAAAADNVIGKVWAIFFPIMAFVASGFEHCVANMYFIPMGIFLKGAPQMADFVAALGAKADALTWGGFVVKNLVPVTLGNIVGGSIFTGLAYWMVFLKGRDDL